VQALQPTSTPAMQLTPEQLESMRTIGLRLDRGGTFWHRGEKVTHARLREALLRWLDVRDGDGRDIIRLDDRRYAYVDVEDAHLRALSARWEDDRCWVDWDDGSEQELAYDSLRQGDDHAMYARVRDKLRGRIGGPAYYTLAERVEEDGRGGFTLLAAGRRWRIENAR
jgi:hypothetical protein